MNLSSVFSQHHTGRAFLICREIVESRNLARVFEGKFITERWLVGVVQCLEAGCVEREQ